MSLLSLNLLSLPTLPFEEVANHIDFQHLDQLTGVRVDLRYASERNFLGRNLYHPMDCRYLHRIAATALAQAAAWLVNAAPGYCLLVLDALRPQRIQEQMWAALQGTDLLMYLADPARGSIHSYGMAVDVTLLDALGNEVDMGTGFDAMVVTSHTDNEAQSVASGVLTETQLKHRLLLREAMQFAGYRSISTEWWHFDYDDRAQVRSTMARVI